MGKAEMTVEFRRGPDFSGFDASVIGRGFLHAMRCSPIPEVELQVFERARLVSFDSEMIVRLALLDEVAGEFTLS